MGGAGHGNGGDGRVGGVHVECDHLKKYMRWLQHDEERYPGGKVYQRVLSHQLCPLVDPELHVIVPSAQVGHHQSAQKDN